MQWLFSQRASETAEEGPTGPEIVAWGSAMRVVAVRSAEALRMKLVRVAQYESGKIEGVVLVERLYAGNWEGKEFRVEVGQSIGEPTDILKKIEGQRRPVKFPLDLTTGGEVVNFTPFQQEVVIEGPGGKQITREKTLWHMEYRDREGTTRTLTQQPEERKFISKKAEKAAPPAPPLWFQDEQWRR